MAYWARNFDGLPELVSEVRCFARQVVGDGAGADLVELVVSELASNAIRHSDSRRPAGTFTLHIGVFVDRWVVRVDDEGGPSEPYICTRPAIEKVEDLDECGDEMETGHGLAVVEAIASKWGVFGDERARAVWAEIQIPKVGTG